MTDTRRTYRALRLVDLLRRLVLLGLLAQGACATLASREPTTSRESEPGEVQPQTPATAENGPDSADAEEETADDDESIVSRRPDKKGRPVSTSFSGYELIREVVEVDGLDVVRITMNGNATIRHQNVVITANRIVVEDGTRGRLEGGVQIYDSSVGLRVFAARADYDRDEQMVSLSGAPSLVVQKGKDKPTLVTCTKITHDLAEKVSKLDADVRIHHETWTVLGDAGTYYDAENRIVLEAEPLVFGKGQFLSGDRIVYDVAARAVNLEGRTALLSLDIGVTPGAAAAPTETGPVDLEEYARLGGEIDPDEVEAERKPADPAERIATLTAGSLVHNFPRDGEPRTEVRGDVLLTRAQTLTIRTPYMLALGRDMHTVHTEQGVEMVDRERNMRVEAAVMDYQRAEEVLRLEGQPTVEFFKKGTEDVEATLSGAVIERDFAEGSTTAWGAVEIERGQYTASGEIAKYYEDAGVIVLEGDPGLQSGASVVRSERILFYPEKNRILLYNRIRGSLGGGS